MDVSDLVTAIPTETGISVPTKLNYPFYSQPPAIAIWAARDLMRRIEAYDFDGYGFGLLHDQGIGKMFGVLIIEDIQGRLGYLSAFSGRIGATNRYKGFVPPVYDLFDKAGWFRSAEAEITAINAEIRQLQEDSTFLKLKSRLKDRTNSFLQEKQHRKALLNQNSRQRKTARNKINDQQVLFRILEEHKAISRQDQFEYKNWLAGQQRLLQTLETEVNNHQQKIDVLKTLRKEKSKGIQIKLFDQYSFINQYGQSRTATDIFREAHQMLPPSGAGECTAPKLLQYALTNQLRPVAIAEFWWGKSPDSEVRQHQAYYPACRGKCYPILQHMLTGIEVEENPLLQTNESLQLKTLYEDEVLMVINKPSGLLSIPGKEILDSVQQRLRYNYSDATGPLVVHRLDMSTSGLMLIAKRLDIYKALQSQFISRTVRKTYHALIDGVPQRQEGMIDLPLITDFYNRPMQKVCRSQGKSAITKYQVISTHDNKAFVKLQPLTGRTHQLRVHAAHPEGLGFPISGDDIYGGSPNNRLCLHASTIEFTHPITAQRVRIESLPDFINSLIL